VRLFVAVPVPPAIRAAVHARLAPVRAAAPTVRWTDPAGWHLTLAFLGEVEAPGPVFDAVGPVAARHRPAALALAAAGRFGDRVLWLGVNAQPAGALVDLAAGVGAALVDAGLLSAEDPAANQPLRAHLTLARKRQTPVDDRLVAAVREELGSAGSGADVDAAWASERVEVWRSHLGRGPARYEVVASFAAAGGADAAP
jgi:RNA 2',3'-cyclic 3'-phosphodiesterase